MVSPNNGSEGGERVDVGPSDVVSWWMHTIAAPIWPFTCSGRIARHSPRRWLAQYSRTRAEASGVGVNCSAGAGGVLPRIQRRSRELIFDLSGALALVAVGDEGPHWAGRIKSTAALSAVS